MKKQITAGESDPIALEDRIKHALANPKGDALIDELMRMYVLKPMMTDDEDVRFEHVAQRAGKAELVLMMHDILNEEPE